MSPKRFSGIKFNNNCYDLGEAGEILAQLMKAVAPSIQATYPEMHIIPGRSSKRYGAWSAFSVKKREDLTKHPHFTVGIQPQKAVVALTIPNGASKDPYWDKIVNLEKCCKKIEEILSVFKKSVSKESKGRRFYFWLEQRHAKDGARGGELIEDATMKVNPEVDEKYATPKQKTKINPYWMKSLSNALHTKSRNINMQFQFCVEYMYYECPIVKSPKFANEVSGVIKSFSPLYNYLVGES